jgi:hypothetical protein
MQIGRETVYKSGKERKWVPTTEDLISETGFSINKLNKTLLWERINECLCL